jgi:hypothetical protein
MFRYPAGDAFANIQFQAINHIRVRVLGCPQQQVLILENINQAGIAFHQGRCEIYDAREHFVQRVRGGHLSAKFMKKIYGRIV